ncbi:sulfite exporter TauE/SafE family protein [Desulfovibrio litoralis]|uniref:Probable membrane transporter protein n=1 Tax=Desulfovibrio litoralis DSM 11393 TaxID=1121455 RepID=A0A1M7S1I5_9BACT|nr:sulfite exporter TauE/SafE family protein [Desulfovibrio litoralis]SHN52358.1 hypothetical protein SAMN02745728_00454 [Desulfovibrio litoralis DSM 11393]
MFFPTAGIEVNPFIPFVVAFVVSFFMSMGGISGAFLLLPFQMSFLGYINPSVSATNHLYNVVAIPSGVIRFIQEKRMVWPLTWIVVIGTLPGVLLGAIIRIKWLPDAASFKPFAGFVLLYIGGRLVLDLLRPQKAGQVKAEEAFRNLVKNFKETAQNQDVSSLQVVTVISKGLSKIEYEFYGERFSFSTKGVFFLCFVVGMVGGTYGIGGGAIMAPFLVSFFGLPIYTIAGATLMGTFITSFAGVGFYMLIAPYYPNLSVSPDFALGILLGVGGMCGMYCGARMQKHVPAKLLKWALAIVITFTALSYLSVLFH